MAGFGLPRLSYDEPLAAPAELYKRGADVEALGRERVAGDPPRIDLRGARRPAVRRSSRVNSDGPPSLPRERHAAGVPPAR
jgi:hypothetical protein